MVAKIRVMLIVTMLLLISHSGMAQQGSTESDKKALDILKKMSDTITQAKTVSFETRSMIPVKGPGDIWVDLHGASRVVMGGKDKLFVETRGDFSHYDLYVNGKTITAYAPEKNVYAVKEGPGTIDAMIENTYKNKERTFPFADILVSDPYAVLTKDVKKAVFVGYSDIDGIRTEHLAFVCEGVEWQIWIGAEDHLPRLINATFAGTDMEPSQIVKISAWKIDGEVDAGSFDFKNTTGAVQVEFKKPQEVLS
ncbi:MAG TPA: DUF2092 domain-containing protein [Candidatus Omnitrophota bacterium]|nr:DUF2092 domain-containing protein [Candidatus Omnitrophota bacterium]